MAAPVVDPPRAVVLGGDGGDGGTEAAAPEGRYAATVDDIRAAAARLAGHAHVTPVSRTAAWVGRRGLAAVGPASGRPRTTAAAGPPPISPLPKVLTCSSIDKLAGRSCFFKCEVFQKGGAHGGGARVCSLWVRRLAAADRTGARAEPSARCPQAPSSSAAPSIRCRSCQTKPPGAGWRRTGACPAPAVSQPADAC